MSGLHVESIGDGPPLVLLHGWAMHGGVWAALPESLAHRFRVHVVDLPGHGRSAPIEPLTIDAIVSVLARRFEAEDDALTLVGWSFGAMVAIAWALATPDRIARLVLLGATPRFVATNDWPHAMDAQTLRRFHDELRVAYRLTLNRFLALQVHGSEHAHAVLAALRERLFSRGEPAPRVLESGLELLASTDLRSRVPAVAAPTLIVAGDRDALTPIGASEWLAGAMPHARLARIEGAAHAPFLSHPREFREAIDGFLDGR